MGDGEGLVWLKEEVQYQERDVGGKFRYIHWSQLMMGTESQTRALVPGLENNSGSWTVLMLERKKVARGKWCLCTYLPYRTWSLLKHECKWRTCGDLREPHLYETEWEMYTAKVSIKDLRINWSRNTKGGESSNKAYTIV